MKWFRFYSEALNDPKVQRLPGDLFKLWVNLLCLANENSERGTLPSDIHDMAWKLRNVTETLQEQLHTLQGLGLLDWDEDAGAYVCHNWSERQKASDDVTSRVNAHRATRKSNETLHVTDKQRFSNALEENREDKNRLREEGEEKRESAIAPAPPKPKAKSKEKGITIPADFEVTPDLIEWASNKAAEHGVYLNTSIMAEQFLTWYRTGDGKHTPHIDWRATWYQWVLRDIQKGGHKNGQSQGITGTSNGTAKARSTERAIREEMEYRARRQAHGNHNEIEVGSRPATP